jgi:hypothetical protein
MNSATPVLYLTCIPNGYREIEISSERTIAVTLSFPTAVFIYGRRSASCTADR